MKAALETPTAKATLSSMVLEGLPLASKRMTEEEFEAWCDEEIAMRSRGGSDRRYSPVLAFELSGYGRILSP